MENIKLFNGYNPHFFEGNEVPLPKLAENYIHDLAAVGDNDKGVVNYVNYSLSLSASHKFPFFTAANIDGALFQKVPRKDNWRKDPRAKEFQWGKELYAAEKSNFDKGHMTKREDVQWGQTLGIARGAADSTFYYTNAVPQHKDLNQDIWKSLEDYILHTETKKNLLKICLFTGPVLSNNNPYFVTTVKGHSVQLPILFWKVVVFMKDDGKLYRVGFIMSQNRLLKEHGMVNELESASTEVDLFMRFEDAATYQVNISLIEELTGLIFHDAIDCYKDERSLRLVLQEVDIDPDLESFSLEQTLGFSIVNIQF